MKINARRVCIFFGLVVLSVAFGFGYNAVATAVEKHSYPRPEPLHSAIRQNADEFGIPETILWATVREQSDFQSNAVSADGRIGLMQLTPERFVFVYETVLQKDAPDTGLLYEPATNLYCGAAYLSWLYQRYGVWETVYAAYYAGTDRVDAWLSDPDLVNERGTLTDIPDRDTASYVKQMEKAVALYQKLYY